MKGYIRLQERRGTRVIHALEVDKREAEKTAAREAAQVQREAEEEATRLRLQQAEEQRRWEAERRQLEEMVAQSLINMSQVEVVKDQETQTLQETREFTQQTDDNEVSVESL